MNNQDTPVVLSREQVKQVAVWLLQKEQEEAASAVIIQYATDEGYGVRRHIDLMHEVALEAGHEVALSQSNLLSQAAEYLFDNGYPEESVDSLLNNVSFYGEQFYHTYSTYPTVVSVASSHTIDIGITGFYFIKPVA